MDRFKPHNSPKIVILSRGTVILDESLQSIKPFLIDLNMRVRIPPQGLLDEEIADIYLPNRIFITNRPQNFLGHSIVYDIGLISIERIEPKSPKDLARIISDAIITFSLWKQRSGFILILMEDGKHKFKHLID